jgi:hypothetical protein
MNRKHKKMAVNENLPLCETLRHASAQRILVAQPK